MSNDSPYLYQDMMHTEWPQWANLFLYRHLFVTFCAVIYATISITSVTILIKYADNGKNMQKIYNIGH